ncbi:MAG: tetratricopeptide repeat protein [Ignavibacteria bacterium]|nr:tetratricopeptide repeat protein [Ignavibacteria bacterium]
MFESDHDRCRKLSTEAMEIHSKDGNKRGVAISLNNIGWSALNQSQLQVGLDAFEESRRIREELGDERGVAFLQVNSGWASIRSGRHAEARTMIERGLKTTTAIGDQQLRSWSLAMLGNLYDDLGDYGKALPLLSESIAIMAEVGNIWTVIFEQCSLARVLHHSGDPEKAYALLTLLQKEIEGTQTLWIEGIVGYEMGSACFALGDHEPSIGYYRRSLELRESVSDLLGIAQCLVGYAEHFRHRGDNETAGGLCRLAHSICVGHGGHLPAWEEAVANDILSLPGAAGAELSSLEDAHKKIDRL